MSSRLEAERWSRSAVLAPVLRIFAAGDPEAQDLEGSLDDSDDVDRKLEIGGDLGR